MDRSVMDYSRYIVLAALIVGGSTSHQNGTKTTSLTCPSGWLLNGELCYKALYNKLDLSWMDANYECEKEGGRLAEPTTPDLSEFLFDIGKTNQEFTEINRWFIGISDMGSEGNWVLSGQCTNPEEFYWGDTAPSNKTINSLDCGVMVLESGGYHWIDVSCTANAGNNTAPLCEIPRADPPPACQENWVLFQDHCYFVSSSPAYWTTARSECERAGGNLASIHSMEENDFILELGGSGHPAIFIGGVKVASVWGWSDGTDWDFENWDSGEPSGSPTTLAMNNRGKWTNLSSNYVYICKI